MNIRSRIPTNYDLKVSLASFKEYSEALGGAYGSTLSAKETSGHILITKGCLSSGVALHALDNPEMKAAFLHFGVKLPSSSHLGNYIPFILEQEVRRKAMANNSVAVAVLHEYTPDCQCKRTTSPQQQ